MRKPMAKTKETVNEVVRKRLEWLEERHGKITPKLVVDDAKSKTSPLHRFFDWNVTRAAYKFWLDQARELIASVTVVVHTDHRTITSVAYVRDPNAEAHEQGY